MDVSKTYIEMCEKAEEIQVGWKPLAGDCFYISEGDFSFGEPAEGGETFIKGSVVHASEIDYPDSRRESNQYYHDKYIWLPRQDQLQEILKTPPFPYYTDSQMMRDCLKFGETQCKKIKGTRYYFLNSMEQLWLAFVMKKKWGKIWSGNDWI